MPSIAIVSSIAYSIANFRGPLIREIVSRGWSVYALAPDYDEAQKELVRNLGAEPIDISMERTGMHPARDLADAVRLAKQLDSLKLDAVFCYFAKPVIFGTLAAAMARVPRRYALIAGLGYVFTPDGEQMPIKRQLLQAIVAGLYRLGLTFAHRVFFQNQDDLDQISGMGLVSRAKCVRLNGTGIDLDRWTPSPAPTKPITFLLMARLLREKGIEEFVAAARLLKPQFPHARFILLGGTDPNPGGLRAEIVRRWHDEGIVEWPGHVDDVQPWIRGCSVYVLPSWREGAPRSTQEAMAVGRAVVTTNTIGCRETVEAGRNGFLVPLRDPPALAEAMRRFLEDPRLVGSMGIESRKLAEEKYDVRAINARMLAEMEIMPSR